MSGFEKVVGGLSKFLKGVEKPRPVPTGYVYLLCLVFLQFALIALIAAFEAIKVAHPGEAIWQALTAIVMGSGCYESFKIATKKD